MIPIPVPITMRCSDQLQTVSTCNEYIPISAIVNGNKVTQEGRSLLKYQFYDVAGRSPFITGRFSTFCETLQNNTETRPEIIRRANLAYSYIGNYGTIYYMTAVGQRVTFFLLLCIKQKYLFNLDRTSLNPKHCALVISREFLHESHSVLYRNIKRLYIDPMEEMYKLDVVYTDNIIEECYNTEAFQEEQFATLIQARAHLDTLNDTLQTAAIQTID